MFVQDAKRFTAFRPPYNYKDIWVILGEKEKILLITGGY